MLEKYWDVLVDRVPFFKGSPKLVTFVKDLLATEDEPVADYLSKFYKTLKFSEQEEQDVWNKKAQHWVSRIRDCNGWLARQNITTMMVRVV